MNDSIYEEPRFKIIAIPEADILNLVCEAGRFIAKTDSHERTKDGDYRLLFKTLTRLTHDLPEGAIVRGVFYDFCRQSFLVKVWHKSFPPVDPSSVTEDCKIEITRYHKSSAEMQRMENKAGNKPWEFLGHP